MGKGKPRARPKPDVEFSLNELDQEKLDAIWAAIDAGAADVVEVGGKIMKVTEAKLLEDEDK